MGKQLQYWSCEDFVRHYKNEQPNPVFVPMTQYLSMPESVAMLETILELQTNSW